MGGQSVATTGLAPPQLQLADAEDRHICGDGIGGAGGRDRQPSVSVSNATDGQHPSARHDAQIKSDRFQANVSHRATVVFWNVGGISLNHEKNFAECTGDISCLIETFLEAGKEDFLQFSTGYAAIFYPASRNVPIGRASGGFCLLYNSKTVKANPNEFKSISESIFYGPVSLRGKKIFIVMVYRTRNENSAVYDDSFDDNLNSLLLLLGDKFVILGGDFNANIGDMTGLFSFLDDAGRFVPENPNRQRQTKQVQIFSPCSRVTSCLDFLIIQVTVFKTPFATRTA